MKVMRKHVHGGELHIGDFDSFGIFLFVEFSTYGQARLGSRSRNELNDCAKTAQGLAAPVNADERKKPVAAANTRFCSFSTIPGRVSEAAQLKARDLQIGRGNGGHDLATAHGKGGKTRQCPLWPET